MHRCHNLAAKMSCMLCRLLCHPTPTHATCCSSNNCKCSACLWLQAKKSLCSFCDFHGMLLLSADVAVRMQQRLQRRTQSCAATSKEPWNKSKVEGTTFWLLLQVQTSHTHHRSMQCKPDVLACCELHTAANGLQKPAPKEAAPYKEERVL